MLDKNGGGSTDNIIAGITWVTQNAHQPAVAVLGIGGVPNEKLDNAVTGLAAVMPVAVPAGEGGVDASQISPAHVLAASTVGASDVQGQVASFANFGQPLGLYAPGVDIPPPLAAMPNVATLSGTSMAAAFVAGAAALYRSQHPDASPTDVATAWCRRRPRTCSRTCPRERPTGFSAPCRPRSPDCCGGVELPASCTQVGAHDVHHLDNGSRTAGRTG